MDQEAREVARDPSPVTREEAEGKPRTFAAFWDFYLRAHTRPGNRALHYMGTTLGVSIIVTAVATQFWWLLLAAPVVGYAFAWSGHFFIEGNKPATFGHPFWSIISDFIMLGKFVTGRLGRDLRRLGIENR